MLTFGIITSAPTQKIIKSGFCLNDGRCYSEGSTIGCYKCQHEDNKIYEWVGNGECGPIPEPQKSKLWIIGATLGPIGAVWFYCIHSFLLHERKRTKIENGVR
ncbi:uncharacterized protein LOC128216778 isoform X2 [Mya arenaria]|uniref:uncharacterized protein LOC128216778 isoform X2 n=1 Tax=Mya arenaria TaxID=6604 RepID=UPI0022E8E0FF|nr:uncharacterized protein LOC128216778 isoform X2 [Mya arenaria]